MNRVKSGTGLGSKKGGVATDVHADLILACEIANLITTPTVISDIRQSTAEPWSVPDETLVSRLTV